MKTTHILATAAVTLVMAGCNAPKGVDEPGEPQAGRAETQGIRNTESIGYSGGAIADKVDSALDTADERGAQIDAQLEGQMSGE